MDAFFLQSSLDQNIKKEQLIRQVIAEFDAEFGGKRIKPPIENAKERSKLDAELIKQLVEWMRWPEEAVAAAVEHLSGQDKYKLTNDVSSVKRLLIHCSQESAMDRNPIGANRRLIANLLDEVVDRLS